MLLGQNRCSMTALLGRTPPTDKGIARTVLDHGVATDLSDNIFEDGQT